MRVKILTVDWSMGGNGANYVIDAETGDGSIVTFWTRDGWKASICKDAKPSDTLDVRATSAGELVWVEA